jgi:hypothetical protein
MRSISASQRCPQQFLHTQLVHLLHPEHALNRTVHVSFGWQLKMPQFQVVIASAGIPLGHSRADQCRVGGQTVDEEESVHRVSKRLGRQTAIVDTLLHCIVEGIHPVINNLFYRYNIIFFVFFSIIFITLYYYYFLK